MKWFDFLLMLLIDLPIFATAVLGILLLKNGRHAMGRPTIKPIFFYSGKFLLFIVWALFAFVATFPAYRAIIPLQIQTVVPDFQKIIAAFLLILANLIIIPAYLAMGISTHIGLPVAEHKLCTSGIYRFSRNPMYASFIFLNIATFLFIPSLLLLLLMFYGSIVHHFIVSAEEKFLESKFGEEYSLYKNRVPRYF
jgi:Putative protein-S-isoprenylcysteine methyltransferase